LGWLQNPKSGSRGSPNGQRQLRPVRSSRHTRRAGGISWSVRRSVSGIDKVPPQAAPRLSKSGLGHCSRTALRVPIAITHRRVAWCAHRAIANAAAPMLSTARRGLGQTNRGLTIPMQVARANAAPPSGPPLSQESRVSLATEAQSDVLQRAHFASQGPFG
jgi:hypothetical protein